MRFGLHHVADSNPPPGGYFINTAKPAVFFFKIVIGPLRPKLNERDTSGSVTSKEDVTENGKKRKKPLKSKESNVTEEENVLGSKASTDDYVKSSGFRQIGGRRKNKPRRAA
ncbi:unnamed protein product [Eruca vesicaria subsp. sativa]|uniref:Uncharacterized protein n=1 Tax=Eruca vesicaria subsp. sativa TaxID=29727 RepID=A0ABC8KSC6_ERUVS|nr:unnamed protein product [Eruca vesicaria subsp. sativa]